MKKLTELRYIGSLQNGRLILPRERMKKEIMELEDMEDVLVIIKPEKQPKTIDQIRAFHGPIVEQVQTYYERIEGLYKCPEAVKDDLKEMFLKKVPQYYTDGSPLMVKMPHPEKKGVFYYWHFERLPSLSDLSIQEMNTFINEIINFFLHERGFIIEIDPNKKKVFQ